MLLTQKRKQQKYLSRTHEKCLFCRSGEPLRQEYVYPGLLLRKVYVKGEVSNCKYHTSGHIYFSLKDETGTISCVMFAGHRRGLAFRMKDGDKVVVGGTVDVYERDGRYQSMRKRSHWKVQVHFMRDTWL